MKPISSSALLSLLGLTLACGVARGQSPAPPVTPHPPIAVRFTLARPGLVTLVIEDAQGRRVRNLISETPFLAGRNVAYWDGLDDLGRDPDAARHGVYDIPGRLVPAGTYRVRGLARPPLTVRYEMMPYTHGDPGWDTKDKAAGWLANHTAPQAALWVPEKDAKRGPGGDTPGGQVLVGSYVTEGGSGLAWLDMTGRKRYGQFWIGGVWTGAPFLAYDAGAAPQAGVYAYTASAWADELRLHGLVTTANKAAAPGDTRFGSGDDRPVLTPTWKFPGGGGAWNSSSPLAAVGGLAVWNGLVAITLPKLHQILFVDAVDHKALGTAALADPRGVAFDAQGRLLALSGATLLRFPPPPADGTGLVSETGLGTPLEMVGWKATANARAEDAPKALGGGPGAHWGTGAAQTPGQSFTVDMGRPRTFTSASLTSPASDYPRGLEVSVSGDGLHWSKPLARGEGQEAGPDRARIGIAALAFPPTTARYLRLVQTGTSHDHWWSIDSLQVCASAARPLPGGEVLAGTVGKDLGGQGTPTPTRRAGVGAPRPLLLPRPSALASPLQDPQGIALDARGEIYISDRGTSHQVKVFAPDGRFLRAIGHPGRPSQGWYDAGHMNDPAGLTVDGKGRLWVAEDNYQPKRVSVWDAQTGALLHAYYGPYKYGGGGVLDPQDRTLFHLDGMTLKLDWKTAAARPIDVYYRQGVAATPTLGDDVDTAPMTPLYAHGHRYVTNCYTTNATNGAAAAILWEIQPNGVAKGVAAVGRANDWGLLKTPAFRSRWPAGADPGADGWWYAEGAAKNASLFIWNDLNGDGKVQPNEVAMRQTDTGSVTVAPDLSFVVARAKTEGAAKGSGEQALRFAPVGFTASGTPRYRLDAGQTLSAGAQPEESTGMGQALLGTDGWTVLTTAPLPFHASAVGGSHHGVPTWQYPSLWPGLHPSHDAPLPDRPGELIGTTRLLGGFVTPKGSDAGRLWAINGNKGNVYLFTQDGLFVATLFQDSRLKGWDAPRAIRGMSVADLSLQEESFYPTITQTVADGKIYLQGDGCLLDVGGLEGIRRLPITELTVSPADLEAARAYFSGQEARRQAGAAAQSGPLPVALRAAPPGVDGDLSDWAKTDFVPVDNHTSAALCVSGGRLYAAFKTGDGSLLSARPEALQNLFKSGGALDLMLDTIPGGERLLVTRVGDKTTAVLYRPHVPGTTTDPVKFVSMIGLNKTTLMDRVDDVSDKVTLAGTGGDYEFSVPLSLLSLSPQGGQTIHGDIGLLRGNGFQTLQRVYWHNKATGLVSDLASEAELTPALWGTWKFR